MIIGITGKKGSGKDTVYEIIKELVPHAERRAFADKLKESAAALLGVTIDDLNEWKFQPGYLTYNPSIDIFSNPNIVSMTIREFLQRYGTEAHRDVFGQDFWLEQCLPKEHANYYNGIIYNGKEPLIVITDVRFDNEAKWILELGGLIWEVVRPSVDDGDTHPSEIPVSSGLIHYTIKNTGTLDDLKAEVKGMIDANYTNG